MALGVVPPLFPVVPRWIWHTNGTLLRRTVRAGDRTLERSSLNPRQLATMAGAPTDQARVCLAVPLLTSTMLPVPSSQASRDGWPVVRSHGTP